MRRLIIVLAVMPILMVFGCGASQNVSTGSTTDLKTESWEREEYRIELSYPSGKIDFGSNLEFVLRIEYPEDESYILLPPVIENDDKYSNTHIFEIDESEPVLTGNQRAVSTISFGVEVWLPGELVFPPLSVSFGEVLTTDEIVLVVDSSFDGEDSEHELSPLYIPEVEKLPAKTLIIAISAAILTTTALIIFIRIRRKKKTARVVSKKTRGELIEEFRINYIEAEGAIDLRAAFASLEQIPSNAANGYFQGLINEARFSKKGISVNEGRRVLTQIYHQLTTEDCDEL